MNGDRLERERAKAMRHPARRALRDALDGEERTLRELHDALPDDPSLSMVAYHLSILQRVGLVACVGGVYRLAL